MIFDHQFSTNIRRYINPFYGNFNSSIHLDRMYEVDFKPNSDQVLLYSGRDESAQKKNISQSDLQKIQENFDLELIEEMKTEDGGTITAYRIKNKE